MSWLRAHPRVIGQMLWPSMGWRRLGRYLLHRLTRLKATPHAIALGLAFGVFSSFTPFMGFHIALATVLAYLFSGNLIAAGLGTLIGNPLTFPFIWLVTYKIGGWFLGAPFAVGDVTPSLTYDALFSGSLSPVLPVFTQMMVGSVPLGVAAAIVCYIPLKLAVTGLQHKRRQRLVGQGRSRSKAGQMATPAMS